MPIEAVICVKKRTIEQAHDAFGHLVLLDYNIRSGRFYVKITEKSCAKILCIFLSGGAYAPYAPCMSTSLKRRSVVAAIVVHRSYHSKQNRVLFGTSFPYIRASVRKQAAAKCMLRKNITLRTGTRSYVTYVAHVP